MTRLLLRLLVSITELSISLVLNMFIGSAQYIYLKKTFSLAPYLNLYDGYICKIVVSLHSEGILR